MKKSNFWKLLSGTVFFATVALASCVDDNDDKGMPYLEVTPDVLTFNADGAPEGASAFTVKSNRPWTLEVLEGSDWVTPSATQGSGDGTVEFTIPASNVGRIAKLSFNLKNAYGAYWTKEVTIEQGEAPKAGEVSALVAYIKNTWPSLESGTEELNYSQKTIPAVILANNEGGNNFGKLYVGDNITLPNSAIILYSTTEFTRDNSAKYPVGKKVTLDLSAAQYAPYGNLRELKNVVVTVSDDPAVEVAVPTLSAATLNEGNYQGQYVRVTNLTPQSSFVGEAWATSAKRVVRFDAAGGETVQSYMATATDAAGFAAITIADKTGALLGTAEQNFKNIQVIPTTPSDVAAFVASGASLGISPEDNLVLASTSGATATVTVTANIAWTATMSGDGFTISPQGGDNNGTVTVTATAANETSASKDLGSITFSGEGVTPLTLRVAQAAKPSAEPKTVAEFVAFVKGLAPASGAEASLGEWTGQTVQGYIAANDAGGNLYQMISVVDNTGDAGSGILLADAAYETVAEYPVGARITLTLDATSTVYNSYGLYKINKVTTAVDNSSPVQMVVPSVTLAQFNSNDYMGMNVKVTGLAFKGEAGEMWYSGTANYSTRLFTDGSGDLAVRTYKTVAWGGELISSTVTAGSLIGVAEVYDGAAQLYPQSAADVADFKVDASTPVITEVDPASLTWGAEETVTKNVAVTVVNLGSNALTVDNDAIAPFTAVVNGTTVTVTPPAPNTTSDDIVRTMTVSVAGGNSREVTLTQFAAGSGGDTKGIYTSMSQFIPASTSTTDRYYPSNSTIDGQPATGFKLGTSSLAGVFTSEALGASLTGDKKLSFYAVAWTGKAATVYIRVNNGGAVSGDGSHAITASAGATGSGNDFTFTDVTDSDYYTFQLTGLTAASTVTISTSPDFTAASDRNTGRAIVLGVQVY